MEIRVFSNKDELAETTADYIYGIAKANPESVFCLAGGNTPLAAYEKICLLPDAREVFSQCHFVGLDEWAGLGRNDQGSCRQMLEEYVFAPLDISDDHIHFFDGKADDLDKECKRIDQTIAELGSIDFALLGIGMNGHIGFNEPGVDPDLYSHVVELDATTKEVSSKYFNEETPVDKGITLGFNHLFSAKEVCVLAIGKQKQEIVQKTKESEPTPQIPSTLIKNHHQSRLWIDKEAAGQ